MFKIIDKDLRLFSCGIADLKPKHLEKILKNWDEDMKIGMLTLFYFEEKHAIVLNHDMENFEEYRDVVLEYMQLNKESRAELLEKAPKSMKYTLEVLDGAMERISYDRELKIVKRQDCPDEYMCFLRHMKNKEGGDIWTLIQAFNYGMMCGKRVERARRKAGMHNGRL